VSLTEKLRRFTIGDREIGVLSSKLHPNKKTLATKG
jgi:hypothetical protein